jgi:uncharacterized membrane protein YczE
MLKQANDIVSVVLAAILGWILLGQIEGIREGTVISAFLVGYILRFLMPIMEPLMVSEHK